MRRREERAREMRNAADGLIVLSEASATTSSSHRIEEDMVEEEMVIEDWTPTIHEDQVRFLKPNPTD